MLFHKDRLYKFAGVVVVFAIANFCYAEEVQNKLDIFGSASLQSGQVSNFKYGAGGEEYLHTWMQDNILALGVKSRINERLGGDVSIKSWLYYSPFPDSVLSDPGRDMKGAALEFALLSARAYMNLSPDPNDSMLGLDVGIFPFKYNQDIRNLGEYLFRTGCYPGFIVSDGFDMAGTQLSGVRLSNNLFGSWHNDLFFTSELYLYPSMDFSLTYLTDFTPFSNKVLNIGGAVQLYRFLSVDKDLTQPKYYAKDRANNRSTYAPNWYLDDNGDTAFYSFAGTKIMARFSFDPKPLLGLDIFGAEDLKLYSEAIILGVKNYPKSIAADGSKINYFGYDKLIEKMPIMFGINIPAFKVLDVLSFEAEYYGKKYANRVPVFMNSMAMMRLPVPYDLNVNYDPISQSGQPSGGGMGQSQNYKDSTYFGGAAQWKWSVYAKKTLLNNFSITTQFARDHKRTKTPLSQNIDSEESLVKDKQWYWVLKFGYSF